MNFFRYKNRDISWLEFNYRVLQEAGDLRVPLYERIKFMAIYSSNLDEFFRVRISALRFFKRLPKQERKRLIDFKPKKELEEILQLVQQQQQELGAIVEMHILPELQAQGIQLLTRWETFTPEQAAFAHHYFHTTIRLHVQAFLLEQEAQAPFLENRGLYFILQFEDREGLTGLVNIPSHTLPRFVKLPAQDGVQMAVTFLDEILRMHLQELFSYPVRNAYSIKMSRDAELYIDDEYSGDLVQKIRASLSNRDTGLPTRLLYDEAMPPDFLADIKARFGLKKPDLIPGGRFHNFHDFMSFPKPENRPELFDPPLPPLPHPDLEQTHSLLESIRQGDRLLHYPYQRFDYLLQLLDEAVRDPEIESFFITMYRVSADSAIVEQLIHACRAGKKVVAFIEAKARFDEASNLQAAQMLEAAGATVLYSLPGLKVHCKALLLEGKRDGQPFRYAYLSTGNFNEKTSRIYADHALLTADSILCADVERVFQYLQQPSGIPVFQRLLVSPWHTRNGFCALVQREIALARQGKPAAMTLKMNSLEDLEMVDLLYEASAAGVHIRLIVRGICCLNPGVPGLSEHIEAIRIVDRFLEHARVYIFDNDGKPEVFLASADWMTRNLERRIEMVFPVRNQALQAELLELIRLQWDDHTKARVIDVKGKSPLRMNDMTNIQARAQLDIYHYLNSVLPL